MRYLLFFLPLIVICLILATRPTQAKQAPALPAPVTDTDFYDNGHPNPAKVELGRFLFFDKIMSGNQNIACSTCHHPLASSADGLSLPVGEGGRGLGTKRDTGEGRRAVRERVPRNAPPLFNLGAREFRVMFHDGRVEAMPEGFRSPAGDDLPPGLDNPLAVQALFPVTSTTEMAGQPDANAVGSAAGSENLTRIWNLLTRRLRNNPEYVTLFKKAYPDIQGHEDITMVHAANAIAAFQASAFRADNSPFDRYLRGDTNAMSPPALRGMTLFYGKANCSSCHSGPFQTDQDFHSIAVPQIGPGKGDGYMGHEDFGRERVTKDKADRYRFRTPTLRNVALTGPWGHDGAFGTLEAVVWHHLDPVKSLYSYDAGQTLLPSRQDLDVRDFMAHRNSEARRTLSASREITRMELDDKEVADLLEFLLSLTDPASRDMRRITPERLPSKLPVQD